MKHILGLKTRVVTCSCVNGSYSLLSALCHTHNPPTLTLPSPVPSPSLPPSHPHPPTPSLPLPPSLPPSHSPTLPPTSPSTTLPPTLPSSLLEHSSVVLRDLRKKADQSIRCALLTITITSNVILRLKNMPTPFYDTSCYRIIP